MIPLLFLTTYAQLRLEPNECPPDFSYNETERMCINQEWYSRSQTLEANIASAKRELDAAAEAMLLFKKLVNETHEKEEKDKATKKFFEALQTHERWLAEMETLRARRDAAFTTTTFWVNPSTPIVRQLFDHVASRTSQDDALKFTKEHVAELMLAGFVSGAWAYAFGSADMFLSLGRFGLPAFGIAAALRYYSTAQYRSIGAPP